MAVWAEGTGVKQLALASHYLSHLTYEHVCVYIALQALTNTETNADSRGPQQFLPRGPQQTLETPWQVNF